MTTKQKKTDHRSAVNGRFVTERFAKSNPAQTVKERNPIGAKKK